MKVIQTHVVRIKFDIYVFITNGVAILALSGQRKKGNRTNNDQQNITRKTNDRATRIGGELRCSGMVTVLLHMLHHRVTVKRHHYMYIRQYTVSTQVIQAPFITYSRLQNLTKL
jgi:hypothetical protein